VDDRLNRNSGGNVSGDNKIAETTTSRFPLWIALAGLVVVADQVTKWAIVKWVELHQVGLEITTWFRITHRQNLGAAWSFLADAGGWQRWFLATLALAVSAYISYWLWTLRSQRSSLLTVGLLLVLGGALGNVIDRIILGYVVDFIAIDLFGWEFPAFNVADSAISVGAGFLIIDAFFGSKLGEASSAEKSEV
jgi:signal peptidase II